MPFFSSQEAYDASLSYFDGDELATSVFLNKYALRDKEGNLLEKTPDDMHRRLAREFARVEYNKFEHPLTEEQIYNYLRNFSRIIPQGSPMYGIGNEHQYVTLSSCYVIPSPNDSFLGINYLDTQIAQISSRRGGVGWDMSTLRPKNMRVSNAAGTTSGVVSFMNRYSNTIREVCQCIHENELVLTKYGLKKIKNVTTTDKVWTKTGWVSVGNVIKNDKKKVYKVTTKAGYSIRTSLDHIFTIENNGVTIEKKLEDINIGDNIVIIPGIEINKQYVKLVQHSYPKKDCHNKSNKLKEVNLPTQLDEKLSYLLGFSYGNGYTEYDKFKEPVSLSLSCSKNHKKIKQKLINIINDKFGFHPTVTDGDGHVEDISIFSKSVLYYLSKNDILKSSALTQKFPEFIIKSPSTVQSAFIAGYLDADGCAQVGKKCYKIASVNKEFIETIQLLLLANGIASKIHNEKRNEKKWSTLYTVVIVGRTAQLRFVQWINESIKVQSKRFVVKKDCWTTPYIARKNNIKSSNFNYINDSDNISANAYQKLIDDGLDLYNLLLRDEIIDINEDEYANVYDLQLESEYLFWCNGFYVHNSGRRGASLQSLSVVHPEIMDFIVCKNDGVSITGSNISVKFTDEFMHAVINQEDEFELKWTVDSDNPKVSRKVNPQDIWNKFIESTWNRAEPGAIFIDTVHRRSTSAIYPGFKEVAPNPCLTYNTKVYTADGRGCVEIGELAKKGDDVDVFCLDDRKNLTIRKMRHPRLTGKNVEIYKITLDDGSVIICTKNHKFLLNSGEYVQTKDLKENDSLYLVTRMEKSIQDIFSSTNANSNYYWLQNGQKITKKIEHRLIAENYYGKIPKGHIVHHVDFNSKNNTPSNLCFMSKKDHDQLHGQQMLGDNNPMRRAHKEWSVEKWEKYRKNMSNNVSGKNNGKYKGNGDNTYFNHGVKLAKSLGRRFSVKEWIEYCKENKIPYNSRYRVKQYNDSYTEFTKKIASHCGLDYVDADPRLTKTYQKMVDNGYNAQIIGKKVVVEKQCELCGKKFMIDHLRRESSFCSQKCVGNYLKNNQEIQEKISEGRKKHEENKKQIAKEKQIHIYNDLKNKLNRLPRMKEWELECKNNNVTYRVSKHSPFQNYKELKEFVSNINHKVVKVEFDGYEDVYNGTVDEFHNFLIGGFKGVSEYNKPKESFIVNSNCGEQYLPDYGCCRLIVINLYTYVKNKFTSDAYFDFDEFKKDVEILQRLADDMVDLDIECINKIVEKIKSDPEPDHVKQIGLDLWEKIRDRSLRDRRTGCGIVGLADTLAAMGFKYDSNDSLKMCDNIFKQFKLAAYSASVKIAMEVGPFPEYDYEKDKQSEFIQDIKQEDPELYESMKQHGRRNMTLLTIAPTGSVSIVAKLSSGLEPVFQLKYKRRKKINPNDTKSRVDFTDKNGDKWQEFPVLHRGLQEWKEVNPDKEITDSPYHNSCAHEIDFVTKVHLQGVIQKHIDNSISVTTNLPADIDKKTVSDLYMTAYEVGCKGFTIYRDGCRSGVLLSDNEKTTVFPEERPKKLPCDVHHITVKGQKYFILVGLLDRKPYEVFAGKNGFLPSKVKTGTIIRKRKDFYKAKFDDADEEISPITAATDEMEEVITRLTSGLLRVGADMHFIVQQLEKVGERQTEMHSFARSVSRSLKKYIPDGTKEDGKCPTCEAENLVRQEGCLLCQSCGYSKCT